MKLNKHFGALITMAITIALLTCCGPLNTNFDTHFTEDGYLIKDSLIEEIDNTSLTSVKFYVEVSGSMNGFFRANKPTKFKQDVWQICSYYSALAPTVTILTNDGHQGAIIPLSQFQRQMNTGAFVSSASTKVPVMINSIISNLNADQGEVAVLISDMKYDPVGSVGAQVLPFQYSTDLSRIFGEYGKSICLVGALSDYLDASGNVLTPRSPYYFFIIGNEKPVMAVRDVISTFLSDNEDFVDNIESGFNYGTPQYSFGIPDLCFQFEEEPTFVQFEEPNGIDTCTIKLRVDVTPYRWLLTDSAVFKECFSAKTTYGSDLKVQNIEMNVQKITNKKIEREAYAEVSLQLYNMATESEVIEWTLNLPDTDYTLFGQFCGSDNPNDPTKTYSLENFIKGMFQGGVVNKTLAPNYILVSKNN